MEYAIGIGIGLVVGLVAGYFLAKSLLAGQFGGPAGMELGKKVAARDEDATPTFAKKLDELFNPPPPKPSGRADPAARHPPARGPVARLPDGEPVRLRRPADRRLGPRHPGQDRRRSSKST